MSKYNKSIDTFIVGRTACPTSTNADIGKQRLSVPRKRIDSC